MYHWLELIEEVFKEGQKAFYLARTDPFRTSMKIGSWPWYATLVALDCIS